MHIFNIAYTEMTLRMALPALVFKTLCALKAETIFFNLEMTVMIQARLHNINDYTKG